MAMTGCGCDLVRRGQELPDYDERRQVYLTDGADERIAWRCPYAGYAEPTDDSPADHLTPEHHRTLRVVGNLTGAGKAALSCMKTCPVWYAGRRWVHRAVEVWNWREKNSAHLVALTVTRPLQCAIDAVDQAVTAKAKSDARDKADRAEQRSRGSSALGSDDDD
jgi:hypothetical protein